MKTFTVFAVLGTAAVAITGVTANAVPEAVVELPSGKFGSLVVERDAEDVNPGIYPCFHGQDDGTIHCPVLERDAHAQPCFGIPGGDTVCPMTKREDCWEAPDGQIHCTNPPKSIKKREDCWEAPDGQIHCTNPPVEKRETCWEAPDGQIHCTNPPDGKRAISSKRSQLVDKRDGAWTCWEATDGQIHCIPKRSIFEKRQGDWHCWETADGQVECAVGKRDDLTDISKRDVDKRQGGWCCWETSDGQIDCVVCKSKREEPKDVQERDVDKRQGGWCCWETSDGQIDCVVCKSKRDDVHKTLPVHHTTELVCYHRGEDDVYCLHEKRVSSTSLHCTSWYNVTTPDPFACMEALSTGNIKLDEFRSLNPLINAQCSNIIAGYAYCIGGTNSTTTTNGTGQMVTITRTITTMLNTPSTISQAGPAAQCRRDVAGRCVAAQLHSSAAAPAYPAYIAPLRVTQNAASLGFTTLTSRRSANTSSTTMGPPGML